MKIWYFIIWFGKKVPVYVRVLFLGIVLSFNGALIEPSGILFLIGLTITVCALPGHLLCNFFKDQYDTYIEEQDETMSLIRNSSTDTF